MAEQRTAEQQNIEPQNTEGWIRCAQSFESIESKKTPSFGIRYLTFDIRFSVPAKWKAGSFPEERDLRWARILYFHRGVPGHLLTDPSNLTI